jgi:hypothetical protein
MRFLIAGKKKERKEKEKVSYYLVLRGLPLGHQTATSFDVASSLSALESCIPFQQHLMVQFDSPLSQLGSSNPIKLNENTNTYQVWICCRCVECTSNQKQYNCTVQQS